MNKFDKIAGYASEKKELSDICKLIKSYDEFSERGFRLPRGVLLCGLPGVGKTVLAEALIEESGVYCEKIDFESVEEDDISDYLDERFKEAVKNAPSIVFIDELDKFVGDPGVGFHESYDMSATRKILKAINDNVCDDVMVVATINDKGMLSAALTRSGRFDKTINVPLPDLEDRKAIIDLYCRGKDIAKKVDLKALAKITAGFSGADIECLVNEAGLCSVLAERRYINQDDFDDAINKIIFKSSKKSKPLEDKDKDIVAVHESGHIVAGLMLNGDNVAGASILPQGGSGGHVKIAQCNRRIQSKNELIKQIIIALAGMAAEKVFFKDDEYLGSSSDVEQASEMVTDIVTSGCAFGFEYLLKSNRDPFTDSGISETRLQKVENKCDKVLNDCMLKANELIESNIDLVKKFVSALKRNYTLTRDDIIKIYKREKKNRRIA